MERAYKKYIAFEPEFVIGFSPTILSFCRINEKRKNKIRRYPKAILCTAGPLTLEEAKEIESFFKAPVCMEYGSVECGVMAYTEPTSGNYKVFWDTHLIQGLRDCNGEIKNIVTRLVPCYVPMIRYDIGDYLETGEQINFNSIIDFKTVIGRPSDMIEIGNGNSFFSALIGDCVKQVDGIIANQLHVFKNGLRIELVSLRYLNDKDYSLIKNRLIMVVPAIDKTKIIIEQVDELQKTIGGKMPLVVRHNKNMSYRPN